MKRGLLEAPVAKPGLSLHLEGRQAGHERVHCKKKGESHGPTGPPVSGNDDEYDMLAEWRWVAGARPG
jgi:hypothetical protein